VTSTSKYIATLLALVLQCVAAPCALAQETGPGISARAWSLTDAESGEYLAGENASERLPMGSTDKIMVALVALKQVEAGKASLADEVTISENAAGFATPLYSNVGLFAGDTLSVRELLAATLIPSGNDAAYALAEHMGGGSVDAFIGMMNEEAEVLGLEDTRFQNPRASTTAASTRAPATSRRWRGQPPSTRSSARQSLRTTQPSPPRTGR
jgi:D-alanyl-D-alanine carboxypeptidase (penicillin-binding protein 5/6)